MGIARRRMRNACCPSLFGESQKPENLAARCRPEMTFAQIGQLIGCSEMMAKKIHRRAIKKLRIALCG